MANATNTPEPQLPRPESLGDLDPKALDALLARASDDDEAVEAAVRDILRQVRAEGDAALLRLGERFDGVRPEALVLGPDDFTAALEAEREARPGLVAAMEVAARHLRIVAERTRPTASTEVVIDAGLRVVERSLPLHRVGCYVPGGKAAYPSSVLMTAVPARAAGVRDVIVASPPGPDGRPPRAVLAACALARVDQCLVSGGAQAIAALAYGTASVGAVDKVVGPGNRYVTAAKRQVYGTVDIDSPAGPSEVIVLADDSADPEWVARDLVAQAEHGEDSRCLLVTPDAKVAEAVARRLGDIVATTARGAVARAALADHGRILVAEDLDAALLFVDRYAPEHLQIMTRDADAVAQRVRNAPALFIGPWTPVPAGDYITGANHVLPTGGAARWASPLSVHDFLRRRTEQRFDRDGARHHGAHAATLARAEGLVAHAESLEARTTDPRPLDGSPEDTA